MKDVTGDGVREIVIGQRRDLGSGTGRGIL